MSSEDQERFEDYLELERYIEALQAGRVVHPPEELTPAQARVYQMAALFRSLSPDAEMRPEFAEQLKERLLASDAEGDVVAPLAREPELPAQISQKVPLVQSMESEVEPPQVAQRKQVERKRMSFFSRRSLLTGGAVAAASLAIGASTEHLIERVQQPVSASNSLSNAPSPTDTSIPSTSVDVAIASNVVTQWLFVTTLETLGTGAVRFVTDSIIGYVVSVTADGNSQANNIIALSAACTHKGCIVRWEDSDRLFHCPCHNGLFDVSGSFVSTARYRYSYPPLPHLNVKIENNKVYVEVPA